MLRRLALCALLLVGSLGCDTHSCTEIGCVEQATLTFATPLTEAGAYQFDVTVDGVSLECGAFVPLRRDGSEPTCADGVLILRESVTTRSGDALSEHAGDTITGIWLEGRVAQISLRVSRDGGELLRTELSPQYRGVEINGEGCGECPIASHRVEN